MTTWRIVEGTNEEGHPDLCDWDLLYYSEYDVILNPGFFAAKAYKRVKFSISNQMPNKEALFHQIGDKEDQ